MNYDHELDAADWSELIRQV